VTESEVFWTLVVFTGAVLGAVLIIIGADGPVLRFLEMFVHALQTVGGR
jgi:hypothetical protein